MLLGTLRRTIGRRTETIAPLGNRCWASTENKLVQVEKNEQNGTSIVSLARAPVNGLNLELLTDLKNALKSVESDGSEGMILTSSFPKIFSAGLDIMEMYKPDINRAETFWKALQDAWLVLYSLNVPTAAAINGSSPAGGCLLAMSCDYRVMVRGKHTIGLNETRLGIVAPRWFMTTMIDTIGYRQAELALLKGTLFTPEEALRVGLIDDLADDKAEAISKCQEYINCFAGVASRARDATKASLRGERIAWLLKNRNEDTSNFIQYLKDPKVQTGLDLYIQSLKKKSKL